MDVPQVLNWELLFEERVIVNKKWKSGLVKRFLVDPKQKLGLGAAISAFYKDGSELLLAIHWAVGTPKAHEAYRRPNNTWRVSKPMTLSYPLHIRLEFESCQQAAKKYSFDSLVSCSIERGKDIKGSKSVLYFDRPVASLNNLAVSPPTE